MLRLPTWKWEWKLVAQLCPILCDPMDCSLPGFLSIVFSRQEYWSRSPFFPSGDLPNPAIEPVSPSLQADSLPSEPPEKPVKSPIITVIKISSFSLTICPIFEQQKKNVSQNFGQWRILNTPESSSVKKYNLSKRSF